MHLNGRHNIKTTTASAALALAFLLIVCKAGGREPSGSIISGDIVRVVDGDTVTLLTADKDEIRIRLAEIDTPERGQPYYQKARQALADRVFRQIVEVETVTWDRYGRAVCKIMLDGEYINAWMIEEGHAWVYRKYSDDPKMLELEAEAKRQKRGIWGLSEFEQIPPWEWRRSR